MGAEQEEVFWLGASKVPGPIKVNWSLEEAFDWLITHARSFHTRTGETQTPPARRGTPANGAAWTR